MENVKTLTFSVVVEPVKKRKVSEKSPIPATVSPEKVEFSEEEVEEEERPRKKRRNVSCLSYSFR